MPDEPTQIQVRLDLPREVLKAESKVAGANYVLGEPQPLPPDPNAREARFIEPVTLIAALTVPILAERILHFALAKRGQGVLVDGREKPPHVSTLAGVPQGIIVLIRPDGESETVRVDTPSEALAKLLGKTLKSGS